MEPWRLLDEATADEARALLLTCCGASLWVERMLARRPFGSRDMLLRAAREEWFGLDTGAWLEAFAHHPKIGDRAARGDRLARTRLLSSAEQARVAAAPENVLRKLADANVEYEQRFGFIYIVCASGKSAGEMLALLEARLHNPPEIEIGIAAEEQARITELRLLKIG